MDHTPTSCKGCAFAALSGPYQVGCLAHDISYEDYEVDPITQTFKFNSKVCQYKRPFIKKNRNIHDFIKKVRKEVRFAYTLIVKCDENTDVNKLVNNYTNLYASPSSFIFMVHKDEHLKLLADKLANNSNKNWKITVNLIPDEQSDMDFCFANYKVPRYVFVEDPNFSPRFFDWLDSQINDKNFAFPLIKGNVKIVPRMLYDATLLPYRIMEEKMAKWSFEELYDFFKRNKDWSQKEGEFC